MVPYPWGAGRNIHASRNRELAMPFIRYFPVLAVVLCLSAAAEPLQAAAAWMAEAQPFAAAAVERHFGSKVKKQCATGQSRVECVAAGDRIDLHWHADVDDGEALEGYLRLPLDGCMVRGKAEEVLGTRLRLDADSVADRSPTVTLSARYWTPGRIWRVSMAFDRDCARLLTITTPAF